MPRLCFTGYPNEQHPHLWSSPLRQLLWCTRCPGGCLSRQLRRRRRSLCRHSRSGGRRLWTLRSLPRPSPCPPLPRRRRFPACLRCHLPRPPAARRAHWCWRGSRDGDGGDHGDDHGGGRVGRADGESEGSRTRV